MQMDFDFIQPNVKLKVPVSLNHVNINKTRFHWTQQRSMRPRLFYLPFYKRFVE